MTRVPCPGEGEEEEEEISLVLSERTLRLEDPLNEVDFSAVLMKVAEVANGRVFSRASKPKVVERAEGVADRVEYEIDRAGLVGQVAGILASGNAVGYIQSELDRVQAQVNQAVNPYFDDYTVKLSAEPEETVTVTITSDHPDAFKFTSDRLTLLSTQTLTFTPENWNQPQTVRVRLAFTAENYVNAAIPSLATLTHTASSGGGTATIQVGVINSQPISDHLYNALIDIFPSVTELVAESLCALNPVCAVLLVGKRVVNLIPGAPELVEKAEETADELAVEFVKRVSGQTAKDRKDAQATAEKFKKHLSPAQQAELAEAARRGGTEGTAKWVQKNLVATRANPSRSVSSKPRGAVQSRIGARSGIEVTTTVPDSSPLLNRVLERSAEYLLAHQSAINAGQFDFDLHDAMNLLGSDFNLPLAALNLAKAEGAAEDGFSRNFALWGSVDYAKFGDTADNFSVDGRNWTFTVGVDGQVTPSLLAGVALSRSSARSDYDYVDSAMTGDYDLDLTVVTPYVNWSATDNLGIWASVGYGKGNSTFSLNTLGNLDLTALSTVNQEDLRQKEESDYFSFAGGLRWEALRSERSKLALKLAGSTTSFMDNDSQQGRLAVEVSRDFPSRRGVFSTSMDLALLVADDATAATEVVGGLDWASANGKLTASTVARSLLFGGERYEWGVGAALNYKAGVRPGEGLSLSLTPSIGSTASELTHLDILSTPEDTRLALQPWQPNAQLSAQLDYGIATGHGLLTPYTEISLSESSTVTSAGLRYKLSSTPLDLDLKGTRRQRHAGDNDHSVLLQLRTQF